MGVLVGIYILQDTYFAVKMVKRKYFNVIPRAIVFSSTRVLFLKKKRIIIQKYIMIKVYILF